MKRILMTFLFFVFCSQLAFAHAWTKKKSGCLWDWWKRYNAYAEVSELVGLTCNEVWVTTGMDWVWDVSVNDYVLVETGYWTLACEDYWESRDYDHQKRCYSSTGVADAIYYKFIDGAWRVAHATARHLSNNTSELSEYSNHPILRAGMGECFETSGESNYENLPNGFSYSSLNVNADFKNGRVECKGLSGKMVVSGSGDFESIYKIVLIKDDVEDGTCTPDPNDSDLCHGSRTELDFDAMQIGYETTIKVTKNGITGSGELLQFAGQLKTLSFKVDGRTETGIGIEFNNVDFSFPVPESETDNWTILCYVDGGYEQEKLSTLLKSNSKTMPASSPTESRSIQITPNPVLDMATIDLNNSMENEHERSISIYDISGKLISRLDVPENEQKVAIDTKSYRKGIYLAVYESSRQRTTCKFIVK